jgi:hypothetical protein
VALVISHPTHTEGRIMAYEKRDMTGSMFKNDRKEQDTHADWRGEIRIEGKDYWVSSWENVTRDGKPWLKLTAKAKDGTAERPEQKEAEFKAAAKKVFNLDDEVPF